jgi:RNA polymerase sigma-70 factor, ECF subfamily
MSTSSPTTDDIERHRSAVTRYIRSLVRDASEAEDLAQETFLRAHRQRNGLRDPAALESWLYHIATHISIDRLRQRARAGQRQVDTAIEDLRLANQNQPSQLTIIQQTEMSECVQRYVASLSDAYKAVLLLHDADGLTANEIARLLQLPLTTVKMRLHRARQQLRIALDKACGFGHDERGVFVCEPKQGNE